MVPCVLVVCLVIQLANLTSKQVVVGGYLLGAIAMGLIVFLPGYGSMYTYLLLGISLAMVVPNLFSAMGNKM